MTPGEFDDVLSQPGREFAELTDADRWTSASARPARSIGNPADGQVVLPRGHMNLLLAGRSDGPVVLRGSLRTPGRSRRPC